MEHILRLVPFTRRDTRIWSNGLQRHRQGEFSFAMAQSSQYPEEFGEVQTSPHATFVGVYDGHGGVQAARYVTENLYPQLISEAIPARRIDNGIITRAFERTDEGFIATVRGSFHAYNEEIAGQGACCLVGIVHQGHLWIANLGDSRAVLGRMGNRGLVAEQLTRLHNCREEVIRNDLRAAHPNDPHVVIEVQHRVFRVRGKLQVTRAIGDGYLKFPDLAISDRVPRFHFQPPITQPIIRADPEIYERDLHADDRFIIFATDGLWDFMSIQDAVSIVGAHPRRGIAKTLVKRAVRNAANIANTSYRAVRRMELGRGGRRDIHDDISVVVLFIDPHPTGPVKELSVRGFDSGPAPLPFRLI